MQPEEQQRLIELVKENFVTPADIARQHGISHSHACHMIKRLGIECIRIGERVLLIPVWELERISSHRQRVVESKQKPPGDPPPWLPPKLKWEDFLSQRRRKEKK